MSLLMLTFFIFLAGAVGGIVNALLSQNAVILPKREVTGTDNKVFRLGFLGNMFISGVAACISWGLYGPFASETILGDKLQANELGSPGLELPLSALVGATLVGVAGARWITNEVDKVLLRTAASKAAQAQPDQDKALQIALASPVGALKIAQSM